MSYRPPYPPPVYITGAGAPPPHDAPPPSSYYYAPPPEPIPPPVIIHNHYEPPPPVIIEDGSSTLEWFPTSTSDVQTLSHRALMAGNEGWDNSPLCVIRAHYNGEFIPGKLAIMHRSAYIPHGGREIPVHNFELLCVPPHVVRWVHSSNGQVPPSAIVAGNTVGGEPLYVGRIRHMNSLTPGKVHPSHGCCYISYGGSEITYHSYEVLCRLYG